MIFKNVEVENILTRKIMLLQLGQCKSRGAYFIVIGHVVTQIHISLFVVKTRAIKVTNEMLCNGYIKSLEFKAIGF